MSDKHKSSYLKSYVGGMNERPMYEERAWGDYKALDYTRYEDGIKSLIKHITIKAGQTIGYQVHHLRDEVLTIIDGTGELLIDGQKRNVGRGDVVRIAKGQRHGLKADETGDLHCIEVQIGTELVESDMEIFECEL